MSVHINLTAVRTVNVFELNISRCYRATTAKARIDQYIWRIVALVINKAERLIQPLHTGLTLLETVIAQLETFPQENFKQTVGQKRK